MSETEIEQDCEAKSKWCDNSVYDAFTDGMSSDLGDDKIRVDMVMAGATFNKVSSIYTHLQEDAGYITSKEDKEAALDEITDVFNIDTEEGLKEAIESFVNMVKGVTETSAAGMIKSYAKREKMVIWTAPKAEKLLRFKGEVLKALRHNPMMTATEMVEFVKTKGSPNDLRTISLYQGIRELCNHVASTRAVEG